MKSQALSFDKLLETLYRLSIEDKEEVKVLLENHIVEARRAKMASNHKKSMVEEKSGKLKFSSSVKELKKML